MDTPYEHDHDPGPARAAFDTSMPTLFQGLLGKDYFRLPPAVRALHAVRGHARYTGVATIARGKGRLARLCARVAGLPPVMDGASLSVALQTTPLRETWRRDFAGFAMASVLDAEGGLLVEQLGPLRFRFALSVYDQALHWRVARVHLFGLLPLPAQWFDRVRCRESADGARYLFDVDASLPVVGRVVRYSGWLLRDG